MYVYMSSHYSGSLKLINKRIADISLYLFFLQLYKNQLWLHLLFQDLHLCVVCVIADLQRIKYVQTALSYAYAFFIKDHVSN